LRLKDVHQHPEIAVEHVGHGLALVLDRGGIHHRAAFEALLVGVRGIQLVVICGHIRAESDQDGLGYRFSRRYQGAGKSGLRFF
jgi:hypothetical protein